MFFYSLQCWVSLGAIYQTLYQALATQCSHKSGIYDDSSGCCQCPHHTELVQTASSTWPGRTLNGRAEALHLGNCFKPSSPPYDLIFKGTEITTRRQCQCWLWSRGLCLGRVRTALRLIFTEWMCESRNLGQKCPWYGCGTNSEILAPALVQ